MLTFRYDKADSRRLHKFERDRLLCRGQSSFRTVTIWCLDSSDHCQVAHKQRQKRQIPSTTRVKESMHISTDCGCGLETTTTTTTSTTTSTAWPPPANSPVTSPVRYGTGITTSTTSRSSVVDPTVTVAFVGSDQVSGDVPSGMAPYSRDAWIISGTVLGIVILLVTLVLCARSRNKKSLHEGSPVPTRRVRFGRRDSDTSIVDSL